MKTTPKQRPNALRGLMLVSITGVLCLFSHRVEAVETAEKPELVTGPPTISGDEPGGAVEDAVSETPGVTWVEEPEADTPKSRRSAAGEEPAPPGGPHYVLEKIAIEGNHKTLRQVILRYIDLKAGDVFTPDDERLQTARYRLLASGFFYDVQFSLKRGSKRGLAVLLVSVDERNTIVVQDVVVGFSEITEFYGSLDVAERSFLGSGVKLSAALVGSMDRQFGYRLRLQDDHFLNSDFSLHVEGLYAKARDFFGKDRVCVEGANEAEEMEDGQSCEANDYQKSVHYAIMNYRRAGGRIGTGYTLVGDLHFSLDYRAEVIAADVPKAGYHRSFGEYRPIEFGHLLWGHSLLSSIAFGIVRDTRDSLTLPSTGSRTAFEVELSSEALGSDYDFAKFTLSHDVYYLLGRRHTLRLSLFGGFITGDTPFFNQFFVGDFSSFIPSRVLELNFSHLQPNLLEMTMISEMRYEDIAASITVEYSLPFYRGQGAICGVNGFVAIGLFLLTSKEHLKIEPEGYTGAQLIPMDLSVDMGIKVDTKVGLFVVSLANLLRLVPHQGATEK
jgi:outer membrane protein insertion porin family